MPHAPRSLFNRPKLWLIAAVGLALWSGACRDTTAPIERGEAPAPPHPVAVQAAPIGKTVLPQMDAFVRSDNANKNFGAQDSLLVAKIGRKSDVARSLIAFPQPAIADSVGTDSLVSATLELTIRRTGTDWGTGRSVALHRMTRAWAEFGATWSCANDINPANNKADCSGNTWSMTAAPLPYATAAIAQQTITNGQAGTVSLDVTSDIRSFLGGQAPNQGWILKLALETQTGTILFQAKESNSKPRLVLSILKKTQVPAQAPDTVPAWFSHDTSWSRSSLKYLKHVVALTFKPGTSLAERTAAVELVGGDVIGGWKTGVVEGAYAIKVADESDSERLFQAIAQLEALPQVRSATTDLLLSPTYLTPNDGNDWKKQQWGLRPSAVNAVGPRWALEAINAPMAWGCDTGSTTAPVTVIDHNYDATEISTNLVSPVPNLGANPLDTVRHGTAITNIIAAKGNDGTGMTGVMWKAGVKAIHIPSAGAGPFGVSTHATAQALLSTLSQSMGQPIVINISLGYRWDSLPGSGTKTKAQDSLNFEAAWAGIIGNMTNVNAQALLVISAGNQNDRGQLDDAWWSGWPQLRDSLPGQVLVVGSSTAGGARASFSSVGPSTDIFAPGESVYTHGPSPSTLVNPGPGNGDSFAAAYVTGVAGLLMSFDPRLEGREVRDLILEGADSGKRVISPTSKKLLDAYEALKAAARRDDAPLCANRLWSDGTHIQVSRTGGYEPIFQFNEPEYGIMELAAHHGGRRIDFLNSRNGERRAITLSGHTWSENPGVLSDTVSMSGVWRSLYGYSHDGSQEVFVHTPTFNEGAGPVVLRRWDGTSVVPYPGSVTINPPLQQPDTGCAWKISGACAFLLTGVDEDAYTMYSFSPIGDRAIAGYSVWKTTTTPNGAFSPCPWSQPHPDTGEPSDLCVESITRVFEPVRAVVYTWPLAGGGVTQLFSLSNSIVGTMEISEDGTEVIVQEGMDAWRHTSKPGGCAENNPTGWCNGDAQATVTPTGCQITYRSTVTGAPVTTIPTHEACINGGIGSSAASIASIRGAPSLKVPSFAKVPPRPPSH